MLTLHLTNLLVKLALHNGVLACHLAKDSTQSLNFTGATTEYLMLLHAQALQALGEAEQGQLEKFPSF